VENEIIVGIDLGTTNSEIALYRNGAIEVVAFEGEQIMPSVVGLSNDGKLLVGTPAKNQALVFPERTVVSIKRKMGTDEIISLGEKKFKPQEISAMILAELKRRAEACLGKPIRKAVITVPAFFSDAQRKATRDAGEIAGFEVMRILNEPTAASMAYESGVRKMRTLLVYDLGGGTFDVSIVETDGEATEVLASHGDTRLGGDDFDRLLLNDVIEEFIRKGNPDPRNNRLAMSRLTQAVVRAKHDLSASPYARIREEHLFENDGIPLHMDIEVSRRRYEELVKPLIEKTFESIAKALQDSRKKASDLDAVLLVGGMTRTPIVEEKLEMTLGKPPRHDVHPDLAVAIGAGVLASRLSGHQDGKVLVDITPYSFGVESVNRTEFGLPLFDVFVPLIKKGTTLPAKETDQFITLLNNQEAWDVNVFQGENPVASRNIRIGHFRAEGFSKVPAGNPILCTFDLDLNGILNVTIVEKCTGLSKRVTIENALGAMAKEDLEKARENLDEFFGKRIEENVDDSEKTESARETWVTNKNPLYIRANGMLDQAEKRMEKFSQEDKKEVGALIVRIKADLNENRLDDLPEVLDRLDDILYYAETE